MEPEKTRRGRPPVGGYQKTVTFRFTLDDWRLLGALAAKRGKSKSGLLRCWVRKAAQEEGIE